MSLIDCTLIEEPENNDEEGELSWMAALLGWVGLFSSGGVN